MKWLNLSASEKTVDPIVVYEDSNPDTTFMEFSSATFDSSGVIYDSGGSIGDYGNNENLTHTISGSVNVMFIKVIIVDLETESSNDVLTISNEYQFFYWVKCIC